MHKRWLVWTAAALIYVVMALTLSLLVPNPTLPDPEPGTLIEGPLSIGPQCARDGTVTNVFGFTAPDGPSGLPWASFDWHDKPECYDASVVFDSRHLAYDLIIWLGIGALVPVVLWLSRRRRSI